MGNSKIHRKKKGTPLASSPGWRGDETTIEVWGVQLAHLAGLPVAADAPFDAACEHIKGLTIGFKGGNRSFAAFLRAKRKTAHLVKDTADAFVSYAWSGGFGATMNALLAHFNGREHETFVWMDFACVDQHRAATEDIQFDVWAETFRTALQTIGKAVLVLTPGEEPIAVTRSWCCFEWVWITKAQIPVEFCVTPGDVERLVARLQRGMGIADFNNIFACINVEASTAFKSSDQEAILALMREVGVLQVNNLIMHRVKAWLMEIADQAQARGDEGTPTRTYVLNAKAALHQVLGDLEGARCFFERALENAYKVRSGEKLVVGALNNLAELLRLQSKLAEAEPLYRESLSIAIRVYGRNHPVVATVFGNCASLLQAQGKLGEAESLFRESLAIRKEALGDNHLDVAWSLNNLASLLQDQGNLSEAEPLLRESLAIQKKILGNDHPDVATALTSLAVLLQDQGKLGEAETLYRESLAIWEKALGENNLFVAVGLSNLAQLLQEKGMFAEAESLYRESLVIKRQVLGNEHSSLSVGLNNLAALLRAQGKFGEAETLYRESLAIDIKVHGGRDHPDVARDLNNLGELLMAQGKLGEAEQLLRESLVIRTKAFGNSHPAVATSFNNLAGVLRDQGRLVEAEALYRETLAIRKRTQGDYHPDVATSLNNLAVMLRDQGNFAEAEPMFRESLAIDVKVYGQNHPRVARDLHNLALLLQHIGKLVEARNLGVETLGVVPQANE